jgi:hypothetical protein
MFLGNDDGHGEGGEDELPPEGEYGSAVIRDAAEKPLIWDKERDCLAVRLEVVRGGVVYAFESIIPANDLKTLRQLFQSAGLPGRGDVDAEALIGRPVGVEVRHKLAKGSGRPYASVGRWFQPDPPKVETRPAARPEVRNTEPGGGAEDIPF